MQGSKAHKAMENDENFNTERHFCCALLAEDAPSSHLLRARFHNQWGDVSKEFLGRVDSVQKSSQSELEHVLAGSRSVQVNTVRGQGWFQGSRGETRLNSGETIVDRI